MACLFQAQSITHPGKSHSTVHSTHIPHSNWRRLEVLCTLSTESRSSSTVCLLGAASIGLEPLLPAVNAHHSLAQVRANLSQDGGVVVVGHGLHSKTWAQCRGISNWAQEVLREGYAVGQLPCLLPLGAELLSRAKRQMGMRGLRMRAAAHSTHCATVKGEDPQQTIPGPAFLLPQVLASHAEPHPPPGEPTDHQELCTAGTRTQLRCDCAWGSTSPCAVGPPRAQATPYVHQ